MHMKWEPTGLKTELARARGLGSARDGTRHWLHQRMTGAANIILVGWFAVNIACLIGRGADYTSVMTWINHGINPILLILMLVSVFYHAKLGLQVVIEDYVHHEGLKVLKIAGMKMMLGAMLVACVFAVLKVTLS